MNGGFYSSDKCDLKAGHISNGSDSNIFVLSEENIHTDHQCTIVLAEGTRG